MEDGKDNSDSLADTIAYLESYLGYAALLSDKSKEETPRASIVVRSYRRLNGDPDGVSVKATLDGIVERGILADDSSKQVKSVKFESITGCKEEQTLIIIQQEI